MVILIQTKSNQPQILQGVYMGVVNVSPKYQHPETLESKQILKSIFRIGVFSKRSKAHISMLIKNLPNPVARDIPQEI